jgi:hypothetical protein
MEWMILFILEYFSKAVVGIFSPIMAGKDVDETEQSLVLSKYEAQF